MEVGVENQVHHLSLRNYTYSYFSVMRKFIEKNIFHYIIKAFIDNSITPELKYAYRIMRNFWYSQSS